MMGAEVVLGVAIATGLYTFLGYPAVLKLVGALGRERPSYPAPSDWPMISITLPVYNGEDVIGGTLERILELDYPPERRQILVVSDGSTDRSEAIVRSFADRGVELLSLSPRRGKSAAENAAAGLLRGEIVINTDASVRIRRDAIRPLVAALADPGVGVASSRDVSVARLGAEANEGEGSYVGYEMAVRDLETRVSGIVGASGCLYAIRTSLHRGAIPEALSRDFSAPLLARRAGYRAVSVPQALCEVPRGTSLRQEYRRKVRTMARGLRTMWWLRDLLDPRRYGGFAFMLWSHKLGRWLLPWTMVLGAGALAMLAAEFLWARAAVAAISVLVVMALVGWSRPEGRRLPRPIALVTFLFAGNIAVLHAWLVAFGGSNTAMWEPTRRTAAADASAQH
jgi:cellulose synthase/poly-beta-1,6-N-acetylglucosamine synthase-like glycosyltransferase